VVDSNNVTNIQWCWSITLKILTAIHLTSGFPIESTSSANLSIDVRPIVIPDISAEKSIKKVATPMET
jgi:hypothetical protein